MKHLATLVIGFGCYALALLTTLYGIAFTLGGLLPTPFTHSTVSPVSAIPATLLDVGLILIFGIQHSLMARAGWKRWWRAVVHPSLERSVYVLIASVVLLALFWFWLPIPGVVWRIDATLLRAVVYGLCLFGWSVVLLSTFQIDHFELFGLRQVWLAAHNQPQPVATFRLPFLYRLVRHPMMTGFLIAFWATPSMTVDRLLFASGMSLYILIGVAFEERGLRRQFGAEYAAYQAQVPRLAPLPRAFRSLASSHSSPLRDGAR